MLVAIAGGSGFVGRHLVRVLVAQGHALRLLVRGGAGAETWSQGQAVVAVDLGGDPAAIAEAVRGCDALVNLVGVKTARTQSFARAHVEVVQRLVAGCEAAGVGRMIHVSVAGVSAGVRGPYLASKWAGEEVVAASRLAWTIVRPGVIYGEGDDFVGNLAAMLRHAAVFPAPGGGRALLQPVAVEDVAGAIAGALMQPGTAGLRLDVVGPERLPVRDWVARVAAALGVRVWQAPAPARLLAPAVMLMERVLATPEDVADRPRSIALATLRLATLLVERTAEVPRACALVAGADAALPTEDRDAGLHAELRALQTARCEGRPRRQ